MASPSTVPGRRRGPRGQRDVPAFGIPGIAAHGAPPTFKNPPRRAIWPDTDLESRQNRSHFLHVTAHSQNALGSQQGIMPLPEHSRSPNHGRYRFLPMATPAWYRQVRAGLPRLSSMERRCTFDHVLREDVPELMVSWTRKSLVRSRDEQTGTDQPFSGVPR